MNLRYKAQILRCLLLFLFLFVCLGCWHNLLLAGTKQLNIAMVLWRGETAAEKGFKAELERLGYETTYTIYDANQSKEQLNDILRNQLDPKRYDLVYTFGTTVSLKTKAFLKQKVPQVFNVVSYPLRSGLVETMSGSSQLIGGVKSDVPLATQVKIAREVIPFQRLGVLFNPREKNSNISLDEIIRLGQDGGFQVVPLRSPPVGGRLIRNLEYLSDDFNGIDAVFLPADSYITSRVEDISKALRAIGLRSIGASEKLLTGGILLGSVVDYVTFGEHAATIVDQYINGKGFEQIPVSLPQPRLMINGNTMNGLGLELRSSSFETEYIF